MQSGEPKCLSTQWCSGPKINNSQESHKSNLQFVYRKVASSNKSCLEAHAGFFRLLMMGIFDPYAL